MRVCKQKSDLKEYQTLAMFDHDTPDGIVIECDNCHSSITILDKDDSSGVSYRCPICQFEILYPGWASW